MSLPAASSSLRLLLESGKADQPPVLFWKHFATDEPRRLAHETVAFYRQFQLSAAKLMPDIPLMFKPHALASWTQVSQLRQFGPIDSVSGAADYLRAVELTRAELEPSDMLLATVYSPLGLIWTWCGQNGSGIRELADGSRSEAHAVLWALAEMVKSLAAGCVQSGADGIYYASGGQDILTTEEYQELGVPYDLAGLRGAVGAEVRLLHVHGSVDGDAERYASYPVQVVGWSETESNLSLVDGARALPGMIMMGGISERASAAQSSIVAEAGRRIGELAGQLGPRFVVAPGCSLPDGTSDETMAALRALVRE